jgi:hypothetical protein
MCISISDEQTPFLIAAQIEQSQCQKGKLDELAWPYQWSIFETAATAVIESLWTI